jgi:hypothetical protein
MFVDSSRIKDLEYIQKILDDPKHPQYRKERYARTREKILSQLKDPELAQLRERLVRATIAEDKVEIQKIQLQIKAHTKEEASR